LLAQHLPNVPFSLSHVLNPTIREYRRASATAIDASLKPLMTRYLGGIEARMREAGFTGRVLVLTSQGGTMEAADLARAPIHAINSGPSMAPIAGKYFAGLEGANGEMRDIIVADTGGTTYDVSLVRGGLIPTSRETWIGTPYRGHMTGFPSVDVKSVGAGGGSIAWVDAGGVLHVGPQSAGSVPGPVCYGKGGTEPTVTDACVALGYIDPDYFLGGSITLDREAARKAIETRIGDRLGLDVERAASSILELVTENMVQAIADITVNQGIDAAESVLIGGGGAAGLNSVWIGRRLGCREVNFPEIGAALSAGGALLSDLTAEFRAAFVATSERFEFGAANAVLASLAAQCGAYAADAGKGALATEISFAFEARYPSQVWDLEVPLPRDRIEPSDLGAMVAAFHAEHRRVFAIDDPDSGIELTGLIARIRCRLRESGLSRLAASEKSSGSARRRRAYFAGHGWADTMVHRISELTPGLAQAGPALIESPFTTIVVDPAARFRVTASGGVVVTP
jgi:N-methylhydantoinase A